MMLGGSLANSASRAKRLNFLSQHDLAGLVEANDAEDILADVDADRGEGLRRLVVIARHGLLLLIEAVSPSG
jgi:hypothetical protein